MVRKCDWHTGCGFPTRDCKVLAASHLTTLRHLEIRSDKIACATWNTKSSQVGSHCRINVSGGGASMRSMKRLTTYFVGAGLALSVAAFAPAAFAQDGGGSTAPGAGSSSSSTMGSSSGASNPSGAAGSNDNSSGGMTSPSGPVSGSSANNPNSAASPSGNMGSSTTSPGSSDSGSSTS